MEPITDTLKRAIQERLNSGESINSLAKSAELSHGQVCRFLSGERELRSGAVARLALVLGLELRPAKRR